MIMRMSNLAATYRLQGRLKEAASLEVQVIETRKTEIGQDHPYTLTDMANLGDILATKPVERGRAARVTGDGNWKDEIWPQSPRYTSMANVAFTWQSARNTDAIDLLRRCLAKQEQIFGSNHPGALLDSQILLKCEIDVLNTHA